MVRTIKRYQSFLIGFIDIIASGLTFIASFYIKDALSPLNLEFNNEYIILLGIITVAWGVFLQITNLSQIPRMNNLLSLFIRYLKFGLIGLIFLYLVIFILKFDTVRPVIILIFSVLNILVLFSIKMIVFRVFRTYRANGHNISNVIMVADDSSIPLIKSILDHKEWGFRILMVLTDSERIRHEFLGKVKVLPLKANIKGLLDIDIIDEVIYCRKEIDQNFLDHYTKVCREIGVKFKIQSRLEQLINMSAKITTIADVPFLTIQNTPENSLELAWKSVIDFFIAFTILMIASPILLIISILIKVTSEGPVIFKQERVGLRGRKFYMYKFRTMVKDAEKLKEKLMEMNESDGPTFKIKKDPRITPIGRFLRKTSLDELPQLFNVLKGEMAIVGPRPALPKEVAQYERWQLRRLSVKPGLTCTWQIVPNRNDVLFDNWMNMDIQYIKSWSLKNDLLLFLKTIKSVILGSGY